MSDEMGAEMQTPGLPTSSNTLGGAVTPVAPYKPRIRRKFPRTKLGCLTCRSRRKKCDERLPICRNCEKRKVECSWPISVQPAADKDRAVNDDASISKQQACHNLQSPPVRAMHNPVSRTTGLTKAPSSLPRHKHSSSPWHVQYALSYASLLSSPHGPLLFSRYLHTTSHSFGLTSTSPSTNPFISYVLPLAFQDDLYLHCVLAASGSDLCYGGEGTVNAGVKKVTCGHYEKVIRGLRKRVGVGMLGGDVVGSVEVLAVVMIMMLFEIVSSTPTPLIFTHLLFSRHLIHTILSSSSLLTSSSQLSLFGYLFELYCYRVLGGSIHSRNQLSTPIPHNLLNLDFFLGSFESTVQFPYYAKSFERRGHLLSVFAPAIAAFVSLRREEDTPSKMTGMVYENLAGRLRAWKSPMTDSIDGSEAQATVELYKATTATIYQRALLIYLHGIYLPSSSLTDIASTATTTNFSPPSTSSSARTSTHQSYAHVYAEIHNLASVTLPLLTSLYPSRAEGMLLWPAMIIGSCLETEEERRQLRDAARRSRYRRGLQSVEWSWECLERFWRMGVEVGWGVRGLAGVIGGGDWSWQ